MKLLHIASFTGNIGDIVNHEGFYTNILKGKCDIETLEIRRFYKNVNDLKFNDEVLNYINSFDGLILGGGGFFDVRWNDSYTGTTFDMNEEFIEGIRIPVLVNAMGVHINYEEQQAIMNFKRFINKVCNKENWLVTLRNDGSKNRLDSIFESYHQIEVVPDNGFAFKRIQYLPSDNTVGLSITNDLFSQRFNGDLNVDVFNECIAEICKNLLNNNNNLLFFLHAPQDIDVIHRIYSILGNEKFRNKIRIAPFDVYTVNNARMINELYCTCKYVIAMRFHANVIAIKNNVPVIGLAGHEQIKGLYDELSLSNQLIIAKNGFEDRLLELIKKIDSIPEIYSGKEEIVNQRISEDHRKYALKVLKFFNIKD